MLNEEEIQNIVSLAKQGDEPSIAKLFQLYNDRVFRFLRIRVGSAEIAEDLTQTVFLEMLQSLARYTPQRSAKFSTWLFQIARFRLIDHYRKRRPEMPIDDILSSAHPALWVQANEDVDLGTIDAALQQLPERYQTVLHLRFREDMAAGDIAKVMKTTALNVRVLQHRALAALKRILEKDPS